MTKDICWLPPLFPFPENIFTYDSYRKYEADLYAIYRKDFLDSHPIFDEKIVKVRFLPKIDGYEESFIHFTCKNYDNIEDREPDFRRCERIKWIRKVIENFMCKQTCPEECSGIKVWEEPYKNSQRVHFLFEDERYLVVLEKRTEYCLLITAYYIDYDHTLRKLMAKFNQYKKAGDAT